MPLVQMMTTPCVPVEDDAKSELTRTKAQLYHARAKAVDAKERLDVALQSNAKLEHALERCKLWLVASQNEVRVLRKPGPNAKVRKIFASANMGNKIEKLAQENAVCPTVLAYACVAQHRKMCKLLASLKSRLDDNMSEHEASKIKHAEEVARLRGLLASTNSELSNSRDEADLFRQHAQRLAEHIGAQQSSRAARMETMEKRCAEAEEQHRTLEQKIATLTKKQLRSKEISVKLYDENRRLVEKRNVGECCVCFEEGKLMSFIPCGHVSCCLSCGAASEFCPICQALIERRAPLFFCV